MRKDRTMTKTRNKAQREYTWTVSFRVVAPTDYKETDIVDAVEQALDDGTPLSKHLDATFITATRANEGDA
jgi:hypothetical protein